MVEDSDLAKDLPHYDKQEERFREQPSTQHQAGSSAPPLPGRASRRLRRACRPRVIDLKLHVPYPFVVEPWDCSAPEPFALVSIKSEQDTVPVPAHWRAKRRYLENKRGLPSGALAFVRDAYERLMQCLQEPQMPLSESLTEEWRLWSRLRGLGDVYVPLDEFDPLRGCTFRPGVVSGALAQALQISELETFSIPSSPWRDGWRRSGHRCPPLYPAMKEANFCWRIEPGPAGCAHHLYDTGNKVHHWGSLRDAADPP
jgi:hypothetical protein